MRNNDPSAPLYGGSSSLCDYILERQLKQIQPRSIVDFGAGGGKNGRIAKEVLAENVRLIAVEGFEKTAQMLSSESLYDEVHHTLIQSWVFEDSSHYDLAIFGDVLEHLRPTEIHRVLRACLGRFKHIVVICPLYEIFQEDVYGNPLEVHQTYITSSFFDRYKPTEKHTIKGENWTIMNVYIFSQYRPEPLYRRASWLVFHSLMVVLQPFGLARPLVDMLKRYLLKYKRLIRD